MDNKNNKYNENQAYLAQQDDKSQSSSKSSIYLRDDHCDWGSSGMNEFTKEYGENN